VAVVPRPMGHDYSVGKALDANRFIELRSHIMNTRNADAAAAYTARVCAVCAAHGWRETPTDGETPAR
jgi:hypothetical protein